MTSIKFSVYYYVQLHIKALVLKAHTTCSVVYFMLHTKAIEYACMNHKTLDAGKMECLQLRSFITTESEHLSCSTLFLNLFTI